MNTKLKVARERCDMTQAKLAERLGGGVKSYQRWEYGKGNPSYPHLRKLCRILFATAEELGYDVKV